MATALDAIDLDEAPGGPAAGPEARTSIWPSIHPRLLELIRRHRLQERYALLWIATGAVMLEDRAVHPPESRLAELRGAGLAQILTRALDLPVVTRPTEGPAENIALLEAGEAKLGFVTVGVALQAWNATGVWAGKAPARSLRSALMRSESQRTSRSTSGSWTPTRRGRTAGGR